jgi:amidase
MQHITIDAQHLVYRMAAGDPAARIHSGNRVTFHTQDCFGNYFYTHSPGQAQDQPPSNPATGPLFVEEARPGDCLKVTIETIELGEAATIESLENCGLLGKRVQGQHFHVLPLKENRLSYLPSISLPLHPMIGVIGTATAGEGVPTLSPGPHGGNLDCKEIGAGATVYLPVFVEGALLSLGDLHGLMGDGEVGYSGLETYGSVTLTVEAIKDFPLAHPLVLNQDRLSFLLSHPSLDEGAEALCLAAHDWLCRQGVLPSLDVVRLLTLLGDLGICQAVNPLKTLRLSLPRTLVDACGIHLP